MYPVTSTVAVDLIDSESGTALGTAGTEMK